jgi:hypothetical protein
MLTITASTLSSNSANGGNTLPGISIGGSGGGGGIDNSGTVMVTGSTFSGNRAVGGSGFVPGSSSGGGIANSGTVTVTGSTFSGNRPSAAFPVTAPGVGSSIASTGC